MLPKRINAFLGHLAYNEKEKRKRTPPSTSTERSYSSIIYCLLLLLKSKQTFQQQQQQQQRATKKEIDPEGYNQLVYRTFISLTGYTQRETERENERQFRILESKERKTE